MKTLKEKNKVIAFNKIAIGQIFKYGNHVYMKISNQNTYNVAGENFISTISTDELVILPTKGPFGKLIF